MTAELARPASRDEDIDTREKAAYAAGRRDADVDSHLQAHEAQIRSHEQRLNAINGSIDRGSRETAALRKSVQEMSDKVSAIAGALSITAAVSEDRGKRQYQEQEAGRWKVGTLVAIVGVVLASGSGLGGIVEALHIAGVI